MCQAVSAAVLNSPKGSITFVDVATSDRAKVLQEKTVDILSLNTTWTSSREIKWGNFTWIIPVVPFGDEQWLNIVKIVLFGLINAEKLKITKANAIRAVGNYGEIYEQYLGPNGVNIPRGPNKLYRNGGQMYAPPILNSKF
ncbi:hypothetical protein [Candidatus Marithrix sp. Canyon 246]|uniref:hypothetical protein n=1 Tax=Candidatus Marithrix sp. Canyon 246 TaxID=1827136 RepID=UPI00084A2227|nr:hypothetical protein [Candidatus Marithrix sp. Canyon 246]